MTAEPRIEITADDPLTLDVDVLAVPVFEDGIEAPGAEPLLMALGLADVPLDRGFEGKTGQVLSLAAPGLPCKRAVFVGLGPLDRLDPEMIRRAAGSVTRTVVDDATSVATTLPLALPGRRAVRAAAEGAILGAYRYDEKRSDPTPAKLESVMLVVPSSLEDAAEAAVERATIHARAQNVARDLVNRPSGDKGPEDFCRQAAEAVGQGVDVEIWDVDRLAGERCGGVLAVGQGSSRPPRMLVMRYRPEHPIATIALVGKGIVFDSGGLSLKRPSVHMEAMKGDMGGAAAVVGAMSALAPLDLHIEVIAICGVAENMPSGSAQRPGDVFTARNGKTVEVLNTDAEGRLVLADALSFAAEHDVDAIVDLATLTGSALHAVGARASGLFTEDEDLARQLLAASEAAGEPTWRLPLWEDLRENLDSEVADLNNLGTGDQAGATMAALFLREFVGDRPWAHLDIAGAAFAEKVRHHLPKQGTGSGVRTLLRWLEHDAV